MIVQYSRGHRINKSTVYPASSLFYVFQQFIVAGPMLNLSSRTAKAVKAIQRAAKGMATVAQRIGDTRVPMSLLEKGAYINYQRIEDNLAVVRDRYEMIVFVVGDL